MTIMLYNIRKKIKKYFEYKDAVKELSAFTDRELADIGIRREDIPYIVKESHKYA